MINPAESIIKIVQGSTYEGSTTSLLKYQNIDGSTKRCSPPLAVPIIQTPKIRSLFVSFSIKSSLATVVRRSLLISLRLCSIPRAPAENADSLRNPLRDTPRHLPSPRRRLFPPRLLQRISLSLSLSLFIYLLSYTFLFGYRENGKRSHHFLSN